MLGKVRRLYYRKLNLIRLKLKGVSVQKNCRIHGMLRLYGETGRIKIGQDFLCNATLRFNPIGGNSNASFCVWENGLIEIGKNVGMSNCAIVSAEKIVIEDDVLIGGGCKIYDTDFHSVDYNHRMETPDRHIKSMPVRIKKGAFIGAHSIILKGVTIGEKSIIGAGSVVTKNVPDGEIWAGNPAKFIRRIYE